MPPRGPDRGVDAVEAARQALDRGQKRISEAEQERDEAAGRLDQALAAVGWMRYSAVTSKKLYSHVANPSAPIPFDDVLRAVEVQRRAAA